MDFNQTYIKKKSYDMTHVKEPTFKFPRGTILSMNDESIDKKHNAHEEVIFLQDYITEYNKYFVKSGDAVTILNMDRHPNIKNSGKRKMEVFIRGDKLVTEDDTKVSFLHDGMKDESISVLKSSEDRKGVIQTEISKNDVKKVYTFSSGNRVRVDGYGDTLFDVSKRIDNDFILLDVNHITKTRTSKRKFESDGKYLFLYIGYEYGSKKTPSNVYKYRKLALMKMSI